MTRHHVAEIERGRGKRRGASDAQRGEGGKRNRDTILGDDLDKNFTREIPNNFEQELIQPL